MVFIICSICLILTGIVLVVKPDYLYHMQHAGSSAERYRALLRLLGYSAVIAGMFLFLYLLSM